MYAREIYQTAVCHECIFVRVYLSVYICVDMHARSQSYKHSYTTVCV